MILPVRCFSCGKLISDKWDGFVQMKQEGKDMKEIWEILGVRRFCCRRMFVTHVNLIDDLLEYSRLQ